VDNYVVDPRPKQLDVRFKLINENWERNNNVQDEMDELGHDHNNQKQRDEIEERYCYLTGFIQTKMKELEVAENFELHVTTELSVKVKLPQLSIPKFSGNLQDWVTFNTSRLRGVLILRELSCQPFTRSISTTRFS
jgi:hypothetical protein